MWQGVRDAVWNIIKFPICMFIFFRTVTFYTEKSSQEVLGGLLGLIIGSLNSCTNCLFTNLTHDGTSDF